MKLNNRVYDVLKFVALVLLPGFSAAYFGLGQIWHFPNVEEVVGSITVLDTFLGLILKSSTTHYEIRKEIHEDEADGELIIAEGDGELHAALGGSIDGLAKMAGKTRVILDVVRQRPTAAVEHDQA